MFVLGEQQKTQDDLMDQLHHYYQYHQASCDKIMLYYDKTGNHKTGITKQTRAEQAASQLRRLGWKVQLCSHGMNNPPHEQKFILWNALLQGNLSQLPRYRMNKSNCHELYLSMRFAKAKPSPKGVQKDKSSERSKSIPRQHATDLSDANDMPIYDLFYHLLKGYGHALPALRMKSH